MKEREFIASFYNAQNTKSGETIFEMIMNIGSETIQEVIFFYKIMIHR